MKNIFTIIKKELYRFFHDKRLVLSTLLMPGLMIYLVYSLMGSALTDFITVDENYQTTVAVINAPASFDSLLENSGLKVKIEKIDSINITEYKQKVADKEQDILIVFPETFDAAVAAYNPADGTAAPNITMYYNSVRTESSAAYASFGALYAQYESSMANKFDINNQTESADLATKKDSVGTVMSSIVPMLVLMLLFSSCMSVAPESIAGEKERGTIATLLVTPIARSELAIGKIISLSVISVCGALSSFLGMIASLPKMLTGMDFDMSFYGTGDYILLLLVIIATVLLMVALISVISAFAKSVKEAGMWVAPLMILTMLLGVTTMFQGDKALSPALFLIPLYNSAQVLASVVSFKAAGLPVALTIISNLVYTFGLVYLLTRLFKNEKVMFSK